MKQHIVWAVAIVLSVSLSAWYLYPFDFGAFGEAAAEKSKAGADVFATVWPILKPVLVLTAIWLGIAFVAKKIAGENNE